MDHQGNDVRLVGALRSVSRNMLMRSWMKPSTQPLGVGGGSMACAQARVIGMLSGSQMGLGVSPCTGLWSSAGSHSSHWLILFAKSVTISEKQVHAAGLGDPPTSGKEQ